MLKKGVKCPNPFGHNTFGILRGKNSPITAFDDNNGFAFKIGSTSSLGGNEVAVKIEMDNHTAPSY
jgi:hypothetical protein